MKKLFAIFNIKDPTEFGHDEDADQKYEDSMKALERMMADEQKEQKTHE